MSLLNPSLSLLLLAMIIACAAAAPSAEPAPPRAAPPPSSQSASAAIVVVREKKGFRSLWVEPASGKPVTVAERKEAVIATSRGLYAYRERDRTAGSIRGCDCDVNEAEEEGGGGDAKCSRQAEVTDATLVHLATGKTEILASAPAPEGCDFFSLHAGRASLKGVIGPIAFFSINTEEMCCNAPHPSFAAEAGARDLETGEPVVLQPEGPSAAAISARARDELLRKGGEGCSLNPAEEPAFYTATFHYDQNGILSGHYVYTMSSTYACGSGPDHYSMAGKIVDPALPAGLARWSAAPEWLRERLGSADVAGVSEIPPGLDRDGALAQFKAPVASPAK
jgi:hypothetical protein